MIKKTYNIYVFFICFLFLIFKLYKINVKNINYLIIGGLCLKKIETDKIPTNQALLNLIKPIGGIEFSINNLQIGENTGRVYGIIKYPATVEMGWSSKICNIPRTIVSQTFTPVDNSALIEAISRNITQNRGIAESTKDVLTRQRAERGAEDGEKIIRQIDQNGETVGIMTIIIMPIARDNNVFQKTCRRVESIIAGQRCKVRGMANLQKQAYKALSPYYGTDETIDTILQRDSTNVNIYRWISVFGIWI